MTHIRSVRGPRGLQRSGGLRLRGWEPRGGTEGDPRPPCPPRPLRGCPGSSPGALPPRAEAGKETEEEPSTQKLGRAPPWAGGPQTSRPCPCACRFPADSVLVWEEDLKQGRPLDATHDKSSTRGAWRDRQLPGQPSLSRTTRGPAAGG